VEEVEPLAAADLRYVVAEALAREGHLFTAGETVVLRVLSSLPPEPAELYARLVSRVGPVFRAASLAYALDVAGALDALHAAGLIHTQLPDDACVAAFDVPALRAACRRLGLPSTGARAELVARLAGRRWRDEAVVLPAHVGLVRRAAHLVFQRAGQALGMLVAERLGHVRWPSYTPTGGPGLFPTRGAMRLRERAVTGAWADPGEPLRVARAGPRDPGPCAWRRAVEHVLTGPVDTAVLATLVAAGADARPRLARALEEEGRLRDALAVCRDPSASAEERVALRRIGRRLARRTGEGWPPDSAAAWRTRTVRLVRAGVRAGRPTWVTPFGPAHVERAVASLPELRARGAVYAENGLWTSLYALVFRDLYWLPVPGMLPGPRRRGPRDVGTPGFLRRRHAEVEARIDAVRREGPARWVAGWSGEELDGLVPIDEVVHAVSNIPGPWAAAVLTRLAREGWGAARGLPDLWIPPGPSVRVDGLIAPTLEDQPLLVEIKGPGDTVRDAQTAWMEWMFEYGIVMEKWDVVEQSRD
jgi:hypothetical protein